MRVSAFRSILGRQNKRLLEYIQYLLFSESSKNKSCRMSCSARGRLLSDGHSPCCREAVGGKQEIGVKAATPDSPWCLALSGQLEINRMVSASVEHSAALPCSLRFHQDSYARPLPLMGSGISACTKFILQVHAATAFWQESSRPNVQLPMKYLTKSTMPQHQGPTQRTSTMRRANATLSSVKARAV